MKNKWESLHMPKWSAGIAHARVLLAAISFQCVFLNDAQAQVLAESNFDSSAEGWTAQSFSTVCAAPLATGTARTSTWIDTGGSTGGFLRHNENNNGTSFFRAPASFLGNKSAAYGGTLSYDARFTTTGSIWAAVDEVYIQGGGNALIADLQQASRDTWGHNSIQIIQGLWHFNSCSGPIATETQIRAILANVSDIFIRAEETTASEVQDLDRVVLDATPGTTACVATWNVQDDGFPSARWRHAVAVDSDRDVLVLFGGDTGETDTWEYNIQSNAWVKRLTPTAPSRRGGHAMVYDRARKKTVLTGGGYNNAGTLQAETYNDVWEFDGVAGTWTKVTALPQGRAAHGMAYDSVRDTIVLYGGLASGQTNALDVLERSSGSRTWQIRFSDVNPDAQIGCALAFDSSRNRTVLIGQGTTSTLVAEWNGGTGLWDLRSFATQVPTRRDNPAIAYDVARARTVLAGGEGSNDTWDYDGVVWTKRANIVLGGRDEHAMAYDGQGARIILSGGIIGSRDPQRDLLSFDGATNAWTSIWSRVSPSPRDHMGAAYDELGQRFIVYGGRLVQRQTIVSQFGSGVFAFDGQNWSSLAVTGNPGIRWRLPLVYDSDRRTMIAYGGATDTQPASASSQVWELNLASLQWTDRTIRPSSPPGQRFDHAAAYDRVRKRTVIFGGESDNGSFLGDTWLLDSATNTWASPAVGVNKPTARAGASMAFDESRGVAVLFGGLTSSSAYDNSVWEWNGTQWSNVTPSAGNPPARMLASLAYCRDRQSILLTGGMSDGTFCRPYSDLWEFRAGHWRKIGQSEAQPIARLVPGFGYDPVRHLVMSFAGDAINSNTYASGQTWALALPTLGCGSCQGDFNGDGQVDDDDFQVFVISYNLLDCAVPAMPSGCPSDINHDSVVDDTDFTFFVQAYNGLVCP